MDRNHHNLLYIPAIACGTTIAIIKQDAIAGAETIAGLGIVIETVSIFAAQFRKRSAERHLLEEALAGTTRILKILWPDQRSDYSICLLGSIEIAGLPGQSFARLLSAEAKKEKPDYSLGIRDSFGIIGVLTIRMRRHGQGETDEAIAKIYLDSGSSQDCATEAAREYLDQKLGLAEAPIEIWSPRTRMGSRILNRTLASG